MLTIQYNDPERCNQMTILVISDYLREILIKMVLFMEYFGRQHPIYS